MSAEKFVTKRSRRATRSGRHMRRIPGLWARLSVLALFVAALTVLMVLLTFKAVRPYHEAGAETARLMLTRRQADALEACNETLRRHIAYLKTPAGIAEEAHRLGYMHAGERPLVILGLIAPGTTNATVPGGASSGDASLLGRFQSHLRDL